MPFVPSQRAAAPWSDHHWWGQYTTAAELPNVAGSSTQLNPELQAGDVAWVVDTAQLYVCQDPTPEEAVWTAFSGQGGSGTALDLYLSPTGSDANPGTDPSQPLATLDHAVDLANEIITVRQPVRIHLPSGNWTMTRPIRVQSPQAPVVVIGDGAGIPGDDGFQVVAGPFTAQAGSTTTSLVTPGGDPVDGYQHLTVQMLSGTAIQNRRHVRNNAAAAITPDAPFTAAPANGDSYRIVRSAVTVTFPAGNADIVVGSGAIIPPQLSIGDALQPTQPLVGFVNLNLHHAGSPARKAFSAPVQFYGCRATSDIASVSWSGREVYVGCDQPGGQATLGPVCGMPSFKSWSGWGLFVDGATLNVDCSDFMGYLHSNNGLLVNGGRFSMIGGAIVFSAAANPAVSIRRGVVDFVIGNPTSTFTNAIRPLIRNANASPNAPAIGAGRANNSSQYGGPVRMRLEVAELQAVAAPCVQAWGDVTLQVGAPVGGSIYLAGAGTVGLSLNYGARAWVTGAPVFTGSLGDNTVDGGATYHTNASFAAAGAFQANPDGTTIQRVY
jgi:hypothetical protein